MEIKEPRSKQIKGGRHTMTQKFLSGLLLAMGLLGYAGGVLHGQNVPDPQPTPQVAPHPQPDPAEAPEPPAPPDSSQVIVLNDGTAYLGVTLGDVTPEKAQELKLPAVAGAIVNDVQADSAAAKAGLEPGDAIVEFDGIRVRSGAELHRLIRETPSGRTVPIKVIRGGKIRLLSAQLKAAPNFKYNMPEIHIPPLNSTMPRMYVPPMNFDGIPPSPEGHRATLGISADNLTPQLAQYFGVKQGKGVLVSEVTKGGPADKAGLKAGDAIVQVNGKSISGVDELRVAVNDDFTGDTRKVSLTIVRDHREQTVNADLTRTPIWEKRTSTAAGGSDDPSLAQNQAQAHQQSGQANQLRALAESQRAFVQGEVLKQQRQMQGEWQRQLHEQLRSLKDQLQQMPKLQVALNHDGEI